MKALVLGGSRFIGLHLVNALLASGHRVSVLNRGQTPIAFSPEVERLYADRHAQETMANAMKGRRFDVVFDLSGYTPRDVEICLQVLLGKVDRYVFCSSTAVYRRSDIFPIQEHFPLEASAGARQYALDKAACEGLLFKAHENGMFAVTTIRPSVVYGPHNPILSREAGFWTRLRLGRLIPVPGDGWTVLHFGHVDDLAAAFLASARRPEALGQAYTITDPEAVTINGYIRLLAEVAGVEPEIVHFDPTSEELQQGRALFPYEWRLSSIYSVGKAQRDLEYQPRYTLRSGMEHTYQWFLQTGLMDRQWDFSLDDVVLKRLGHSRRG